MQNLFEEYQNIIPDSPSLAVIASSATKPSVDSCIGQFEKKYDANVFDNIRSTDFDQQSPLFGDPLYISFLQIIDILFIIYLKREEKITLDTYTDKKQEPYRTEKSDSNKGIASLIDLEEPSAATATETKEDESVLDKLKKKYTRSFIIWYCRKFRGYIDELRAKLTTLPKVFEDKKFAMLQADKSKYGDYFSAFMYLIYFLNKMKISDRTTYTKIAADLESKIKLERLSQLYDDLIMANETVAKQIAKPIEGLSCYEQLYNRAQYFKPLNGSKKELLKYLNKEHSFITKIDTNKGQPRFTVLDADNKQKIIGADIKKRDTGFAIYCYTSENKTEDLYQVKYRDQENKTGLKKIVEITCANPKSDDKIAKIEYVIPFVIPKEKRSIFKKEYVMNSAAGIAIKINDNRYFDIAKTSESIAIRRRDNDIIIVDYVNKIMSNENDKKQANALKTLLEDFEIKKFELHQEFATNPMIPFELIIALISAIVFNVFADKFEGVELKKKTKSLFGKDGNKKPIQKPEEKFEKIDYLEDEYKA